jgi:hypothetical protein
MLAGLGSIVFDSTALASDPNAGVVVFGALVLIALGAALGGVFGLVYRLLRLTTDFGLAIYTGLGYGLLLFMLAFIVLQAAASVSAATLLVPLLIMTSGIGLFYTALCPTPYANPQPEQLRVT